MIRPALVPRGILKAARAAPRPRDQEYAGLAVRVNDDHSRVLGWVEVYGDWPAGGHYHYLPGRWYKTRQEVYDTLLAEFGLCQFSN